MDIKFVLCLILITLIFMFELAIVQHLTTTTARAILALG